MPEMAPYYSVIIAGAGPVGLALAAELGLSNIDCLIVEKRDGSVNVPKMSLVCAGTMEIARRWGIAKSIRSAVWSENRALDFLYIESLKGREYARVQMPAYDASPPPWTPEGMCHCPQIYFDPILAARVAEHPTVTRRNNTAVEDFEQDGSGVTVLLRDQHTGQSRKIRADYLIGCDGPGGIVRAKLDIGLEGRGAIANSINIFFRSPDLATLHDKGWGRIYRFIGENGCWSELIPIDGDVLWRLTVFDDPAYVTDPAAALRQMMGQDFPYEILSALPWERRDFIAESYRHGRVFIAGDAAHQSSPTGGVGMHTGVEDAVNLAWKLVAMLQGWGGRQLLDSYQTERKPVAARNVSLSTSTYEAIRRIPGKDLQSSDRADSWRNHMSDLYIPDIIRCRYSYQSPVIAGQPVTATPRVNDTLHPAAPGWRAPHAWLADGRSTLDLFGDGFKLLRLGHASPPADPLIGAANRLRVPVEEVTIPEPTVAGAFEQPLVLVRPDRHIAWRGSTCPDDCEALLALVTGQSERT